VWLGDSSSGICFVLIQLGSKRKSRGRLQLYLDYNNHVIVKGWGFGSSHSKGQPFYKPDWDVLDTAVPYDAPSGWRTSDDRTRRFAAGPSS
jgi:hypothetical protein